MNATVRSALVGSAMVVAGFALVLLQERESVREYLRHRRAETGGHLTESQVKAIAIDLATPDLRRARDAADRLAAAGPAALTVLDDLIAALRSFDATVRLRAARAIGALGPAANRAVPEVAKGLAETNHTHLEGVIDALRALKPDAAQSRELFPWVWTPERLHIMHARRLVPALDPVAALERLQPALREPDAQVRRRAADLIAHMETAASAACPELAAALRAVDQDVVHDAAWALGECCRDAASVQALVERMQRADPYLVMRCANALAKMGPAAAAALPALLAAADLREAQGGVPATVAYVAVGGDRQVAMTKLLERVRNPRDRRDWEACRALAELGVASPEVLAALREASKRPGGIEQGAARSALQRLERARD